MPLRSSLRGCLWVQSRTADPKRLTDLIGVQPTYTCALGEYAPKASHPNSRTHVWRIDTDPAYFRTPRFDASVLYAEILQHLGEAAYPRLKQLSESGEATVRFSMAAKIVDEIPPLYVEPWIVRAIAECGGSIDHDVYVLSEGTGND